MKLNIRRILFYLWPHVKKHWVACVLLFLFYTIGVVFGSILRPYLYKQIIDLLSSDLAKDVILNKISYLTILFCGVLVIYTIGYRAGDYVTSYFSSNVMKKLYDFAFSKLLIHSYNFFSNNFSGSLIAKAKRLPNAFDTLFDILVYQVYTTAITLIGILVVLFINIPIYGYVFLGWSIIYITIGVLFVKKKIKYDLLVAEADSKITGKLSDAINNILNIKIFSSSIFEKKSFALATADEENKRRKDWYLASTQNLIQNCMSLALQIIFWVGSITLWSKGKISIGLIVLLQMYMVNLIDILWGLSKSITKAVKSLTDMQEVVDIFSLTPDLLDPEHPEPLRIKEGNIVFNNVKFSYNQGTDILKEFNLNIKTGEHIGLVGHSGAGKSTVTKLILRFLDTTEGSILIDGQDIKNITQDDLRSAISYVPQEPILFHRTIKENILYSCPDATEEEMIEVAKKAYAHDFIVGLPKGYETLVGERGVKLSGGERQRVAIARAMLKNAPILILDEATSSLDSLSEKYIQEAFVELMKDKTTVVIAHRLSTIQKMDKIVVMNEGDIIESGTHQELIKKDGVYAELWNHQSGGFIEE